MKKLYDGKTKTVYEASSDQVILEFKDDVTGTEDGIDPGGNEVVGSVEGKGMAVLRQSAYFFKLLKEANIPTHFISANLEKRTLTAKKANWYGLEFVVRFKAFGSFVRRYGGIVTEGVPLNSLVEITIKDDERGDPLILEDTLDVLGIMPLDDVIKGKELVKRAAEVIKDDLSSKGLELIDMKFEIGNVGDGLAIIDDISSDNMRVMKNGEVLSALDLTLE